MANHGIASAAIEVLREKDKRRNQRHPIELTGRIKFADGREDICKTVNASSGGLEVRCSAPGPVGSRVTCHFGELGWVDGEIRRHTDTGFAMQFAGSPERLTRVAARVEWLSINHSDPNADNRASTRIVPIKTEVSVHFDTCLAQGRIIDISVSGVAIATESRPKAGSSVTLGKRRAKVIRLLPDGFAAEFNLPLALSQFDANVVL